MPTLYLKDQRRSMSRQSLLLVSATIASALVSLIPTPAQAGTSVCYEVQDRDGWSYVRSLATRKVIGRLDNGTRFSSTYLTNDNFAIVGGMGEPTTVVALSRLRVIPDVRCDRQYWTVIDRDGWANLRSRPNGPVTSRLNDGETVLFLKASGAALLK
jgi:hypothetical protein